MSIFPKYRKGKSILRYVVEYDVDRNQDVGTLVECLKDKAQEVGTKLENGVEVISMTYFLTLKEILTRRQRSKWDVDYLPLLLLIEVCWICASSHPLVTCLYGTSRFE
jgi:hypothetical protein